MRGPELRAALALAEARQSQLRAEHYQTRIATGVWRSRIGHVFRGPLTDPDTRPLTPDEVLADEVQTMAAHIDRAENCLDVVKQQLAVLDAEHSEN